MKDQGNLKEYPEVEDVLADDRTDSTSESGWSAFEGGFLRRNLAYQFPHFFDDTQVDSEAAFALEGLETTWVPTCSPICLWLPLWLGPLVMDDEELGVASP